MGTTIGTLVRLANYSDTVQTVFMAVLKLHTELHVLRYPKTWMRTCLYKIQTRSDTWSAVLQLWKLMHIESYQV